MEGRTYVDPCTVFSPITYSRLHDTTETLQQVEAFNAKWTALCPTEAAALKKSIAATRSGTARGAPN